VGALTTLGLLFEIEGEAAWRPEDVWKEFAYQSLLIATHFVTFYFAVFSYIFTEVNCTSLHVTLLAQFA